MPSTWIPQAEIDAQRTSAELTFPHSCVISRVTETADGQGGRAQTWAAIGTADCRIVANSGDTKTIADRFGKVGGYTLTLPHDTDIEEQDKATIDSIVYRVVAVDLVREWRTAVRAQVNLEIT